MQFFWVWVPLDRPVPSLAEADLTPCAPAPPGRSPTWLAGAAAWAPSSEYRCRRQTRRRAYCRYRASPWEQAERMLHSDKRYLISKNLKKTNLLSTAHKFHRPVAMQGPCSHHGSNCPLLKNCGAQLRGRKKGFGKEVSSGFTFRVRFPLLLANRDIVLTNEKQRLIFLSASIEF